MYIKCKARGGQGGKGNYYFLSNEKRKPTEFEYGHEGQSMTLNIELKLIADAALVNLKKVFKYLKKSKCVSLI
jgi:GTP-binding protein